MEPYSQQLAGRSLADGWTAVRIIPRDYAATGGCFSNQYLAEGPDGQQGFLKALDFSGAFLSGDVTKNLEVLTTAFNFERDLLLRCRDHKMSRVVRAIADGTIVVDPAVPASVVPYLIFELADGDVRTHTAFSVRFDLAWVLRTLHQVATGLNQLHKIGTAHQDVKPSNLMVFDQYGVKLGDLGRAAAQGQTPPHHDFPIAGDPAYAPPELLYRETPTDWNQRRFGCDAYLLGSMAVFFFTRVGMTSLLMAEVHQSHHHRRWTGTYADVLPYVRDAFGKAIKRFSESVNPELREQLSTAVRQLCDPDPPLRGHPRSRVSRGNPYSLERYVSTFDLLATRAERGLIRALA